MMCHRKALCFRVTFVPAVSVLYSSSVQPGCCLVCFSWQLLLENQLHLEQVGIKADVHMPVLQHCKAFGYRKT